MTNEQTARILKRNTTNMETAYMIERAEQLARETFRALGSRSPFINKEMMAMKDELNNRGEDDVLLLKAWYNIFDGMARVATLRLMQNRL